MLHTILAQSSDNSGAAGALGGMCCACFILIIMVGVMAAGCWKIFVKAGKPGWAALIPFYNFMVLAEIVGRPAWWGLLTLIPLFGYVVYVILCLDLAKSFGKDVIYGLGLAFLSPIFVPILGFSNAKYVGPSVQS